MDAVVEPAASADAVDAFIKRWKGSDGSERSNFQPFMRDLCDLLALPHPLTTAKKGYTDLMVDLTFA